MILINIDKNWTRLVGATCKLLRRRQVTDDRPAVAVTEIVAATVPPSSAPPQTPL